MAYKSLFKTRLDKIQEELDNQVYVVEDEKGEKVSQSKPTTRLDEIAPINKTFASTSEINKILTEKEKDNKSWLSAFNDGYDFGDISKTILKGGATLGKTVYDTGKELVTNPLQTLKTTGVGVASGLDRANKALNNATSDLFDWMTGRDSEDKGLSVDEFNSLSKSTDEKTKAKILEDARKQYGENSKYYKALVSQLNSTKNTNLLNMKYTDTDTYKDYLEGNLSDAQQNIWGIGENIGAMLPSIAVSSVASPVAGSALFFIQAQQNYTDEARARGYTDKDARIYGLIMGGAEVLVERLGFDELGGLSKLSSASLKKAAVGEGLEEFVMPYIDSTVKSIGYGESFDLSGTAKESLESAVMGATVGLIMNAGGKGLVKVDNAINKINSNQKLEQKDIVEAAKEIETKDPNYFKEVMNNVTGILKARVNPNGYTRNELSVIDAIATQRSDELARQQGIENEIENAISNRETEQGGILSEKEKAAIREGILSKAETGEIDVSSSKLSDKEISKIRKEIEDKLKQGLIDTDTIESVLGTETDLTNDSYLQKSYQEKAKRSQNFTYDTKKITNAQEKAVYDSAAKYFNDTTRSHEFVEKVAKISKEKGTNYGFINNEELKSLGHNVEGKQVNGLVRTSQDGKQTVLINVDSPKALNTIVGHETTHLLEGTQEYQELQDVIFEYAKTKGDFDARQKTLNSLYEGIDADINSELTADLVGDYLFTDAEFINNLSVQKPTVFQRIKELIDDLVAKFTGTKEEKQLREVQKRFKEAYRQNVASKETNTQYSFAGVKGAKNNQKVLSRLETAQQLEQDGTTNEDIRQQTGWFKGTDGQWRIEIADRDSNIATKINPNTTYKLGDILQHDKLFEAYPELKNYKVAFKDLKGNGKFNYLTNTISLNNKFASDLDSLKGTLMHEVQHAIQKREGFARGTYYDGKNPDDYRNSAGEQEARNVKERLDYTKEQIKDVAPTLSKQDSNRIHEVGLFSRRINASDVTTDNQGRTLTQEQQEYFKDSKVRDEEGNLVTVYHGTTEEINVFDKNRLGSNTGAASATQGFFFTSSKEVSEAYSMYARPKYLQELEKKYQELEKIAQTERTNEAWNNYYRAYEEYEDAELDYASGGRKNYENQKEVYLNITNPLVHDFDGLEYRDESYYDLIKQAKENGNDGVILKNTYDGYGDHDSWYNPRTNIYVAFESNQIKNIDNTNPTSNEDIRYSLSEGTQYDYQSLRPKVRGGWTIEKIQKQLKQESSSRVNSKEIAKFDNIDDLMKNVYYHGSISAHDNLKAGSTLPEHMRTGGYGEAYHTISLSGNKNIASNFASMGPDGTVMPVILKKGANVIEMANIEDSIELEDMLPELWDKKIDAVKIGDWDIEKVGYGEQEIVILNPKAIMTLPEGTTYFKNYHKPKFQNMTSEEVKEVLNKTLQRALNDPKTTEERNKIILERYNKVLQEKPDINMSLSNPNEQIAPTGNYNVYGEDVKLQQTIAPLQEEIQTLTETVNELKEQLAPVQEIEQVKEVEYTQPSKAELDNLMALMETGGTEYANTFFGLRDKYGQRKLYKGINEYKKAPDTYEAPIKGDEFAPITEADLPMLEQQYEQAFQNIDESSIPSELEDTTPDVENEITETKSLFETRNYEDVGNRKVNAYQYDNPEVKPFFQEEAQAMLGDLQRSVKGERQYNDDLYYSSGGEQGYFGTQRQTTSDIAELLDGMDGKYKYTYADIEKGLNAIIKDEGAENNAISKRIEFYLDQRLREGYTTIDGIEVPANQEYIKTLQAKEITDFYNNIPIDENLAPVENSVENVSNSELIAPVKEQYEAIRPEKSSEPRMIRVKEPQKLGKVEGRVTEPSIPEPINGAKQLTIEGTEEDLVTKTKKELRKALLGTEQQKQFITDALDNAKNRSMVLMNNTDTIRNTELVFGREAGKVINDAIFQKEIDNEADSIAWQNQERQEIKDLGIKPRSKESAAVQKYGEKQYVNENDELVPYGDKELASEFSDVETQEKIKHAAQVLRNKYDNYIEDANNVLTKLGFDPIKKRTDYMRHFQELNDVFSRHGIPFNAKSMQEHVLPTDINGLTEFWSPQKNYFANMQARKGIKTTYDAITGIDGYISGISNLIFHTEDIQRGRAFEELIRETYGEDKGWDNLDSLPDSLKQERADKIQNNHLSNYAAWVHEWTNNVAGKKNKLDRSVEAMFGRKAFSFLDNTRKQVGSNMIGFNISSSLTNLIAPVQAMAKTNKLAVVKGTADTIKNIFVKDNFIDNNKFLTSRMGTDMLSKNAWQKIQDAGYVFMKGMDWFSSNQIVRSKYYELRAKGLSEADAHAQAGQFAARIMGDRTKGANAQLYNSKLVGLVTQFQLEVNNQLYSTFYDTYQESKTNAKGNALKTAAGMTFTLGQLFGLTHLFGKTFESIAGYNPTFDVVEMIKTALGWDDDDDEKTTSERLKEAGDMLVDALPYVNILTGGGRIPISSGIPNVVGVMTGGKDDYGNELTWEDELKKLLYLVPPTGGNQVKKTYQGLSMFDKDLPVTGSYTDSGNLRFPVEDTLQNKVQAALFGQYASKNAQQYFDKERTPLKEKQIQEFADLDLPIADYWEYRDGLKDLNTLEEKFEYVNNLDVTTDQKNIMINNIVDRKEEVDMSNYDDFGSYEEFDFAIKNEEKYDFLQKNNISYSEYTESEHSKEAYNWAYNNPDSYLVSKAVTDNVVAYRQYASEIDDIKADKDEDGKSISGSRKEKVFDYINNLNIDFEQRLILAKKYYPAYDEYNYEIIEYLNGRNDISYEDEVTILKELGFEVDSKGNISWD